MNKFCRIFLNILLFLILYACNGDKPSNNMVFDNVSYIENFPKSCNLENGRLLDLNQAGVESLWIKDSLLIVSTSNKDGYWSFFKLPEYTFLGKYITAGKSDNELLTSPRVANQYFVKRAGELCTMIYDFNTGKVLLMNITKTLNDKQMKINRIDYGIPRGLYNFVCLDSLSFFCKKVNSDFTEQLRFILINGEQLIPNNMEILNQASVDVGYDFNILGTFCKYNSTTCRIVEAAMDLNHINLYSIDSSFHLTICTGKQLDKIKEVQSVERREKKVMYDHLASYANYFAALYQDDTVENIHFNRAKNQVIQFFDWDGKPLVEVILDRRINSFDIDFSNQCLYTLSYEQDEMYIYDFKEVLEILKI